MCTMIVEKVKIDGSGKGAGGWFNLEQANVSYDHPFNAPMEHALNIDFVNPSQGPSARVPRIRSTPPPRAPKVLGKGSRSQCSARAPSAR